MSSPTEKIDANTEAIAKLQTEIAGLQDTIKATDQKLASHDDSIQKIDGLAEGQAEQTQQLGRIEALLACKAPAHDPTQAPETPAAPDASATEPANAPAAPDSEPAAQLSEDFIAKCVAEATKGQLEPLVAKVEELTKANAEINATKLPDTDDDITTAATAGDESNQLAEAKTYADIFLRDKEVNPEGVTLQEASLPALTLMENKWGREDKFQLNADGSLPKPNMLLNRIVGRTRTVTIG